MSTPAEDRVEVYLDAANLGPRRLVGTLRRVDRGSTPIAFAYDPDWVDDDGFFLLDPAHYPYPGDQFPAAGRLLAAVFADSAPDRWGRMILERREAEHARIAGRRPRALREWDFLLQVNDATRMGALRFAASANGPFLSDERDAIPALTDLAELQRAARELESPSSTQQSTSDAIARLVAPGSSLGGARPKATFGAADRSLWMAKFPSHDDRRDVGAWEHVLNRLAERAGIDVPETSLLRLTGSYHTFLARRFDRDEGDGRRLYASAITMTGKLDHEAAGYADLAEAIERHGAPATIGDDLAQLFRRLIFNIATGHRDDHLRNHGFLRSQAGWRLAPAFDLNPMPDMADHQLATGATSHHPDTGLAVAELAPLCRLSEQQARRIRDEIVDATADWRELAREVGLQRSEIDLMRGAFLG